MTVSQSQPAIKTVKLATTVFIALSLPSFSRKIGPRNEALVSYISLQ